MGYMLLRYRMMVDFLFGIVRDYDILLYLLMTKTLRWKGFIYTAYIHHREPGYDITAGSWKQQLAHKPSINAPYWLFL